MTHPETITASYSAPVTEEGLIALVVATQRGDRQAFEQLYRRTRPAVARLIRALLGGLGGSEDLVQETYMRVWTKISALREPATFWTWLRRIAVNLTLRRQEQNSKKGWNLIVDPGECDASSDRGDPARVVPGLVDLRAGLARLPARDRALLILREVHGCSYDDIAAILSLPVGTVRSRLHSSRKKILQQLNEKEPGA